MGIFDEILKADAAFAFCDPDVFGEPVVYRPKTGPARNLSAQVFREVRSVVAGAQAAAPSLQVFIPRSADPTVGVETVDVHGDRVAVAERVGGKVDDHVVVQIVSSDAGGWMLGLR